MLIVTYELLKDNPDPTEEEVRLAVAGVLCRCTGYKQIIDAVIAAAPKMRGG
jgi:carbon-monoxide dehydrogenase small subunit